MRTNEIIRSLPEITIKLATASGVDLDVAREYPITIGDEPTTSEGTRLAKLRHLQRLVAVGHNDHDIAPDDENRGTGQQLGVLAIISEEDAAAFRGRDRRFIKRVVTNLATTVIFDAVAGDKPQPVQVVALRELTELVPLLRRQSAKRRVDQAAQRLTA